MFYLGIEKCMARARTKRKTANTPSRITTIGPPLSSPDTGNNTEISVIDCTRAGNSSTWNIRG